MNRQMLNGNPWKLRQIEMICARIHESGRGKSFRNPEVKVAIMHVIEKNLALEQEMPRDFHNH